MRYFVYVALLLYTFTSLNAQTLQVNKVFSNLGGVIWGMSFINNHEAIITLKSGGVKYINTQTKEIKNIATIDVLNEGQGGLLDVAVSPKFNHDKKLYFTYVKGIENQGTTTLAVANFENKKLTDFKDIFVSQSRSDTSRHFGSRIAFDEHNHIYFTIGDRGVRPNAQDNSNHAGTVIRLHLDGTIPKDNPLYGKKGLDEIYSFGHRNPQGLFFDKKTKKLFLVEHGPRGGDEINIVKKGANYGWPVISYGKEYWNPFPVGESTHKEGMEQPIKVYIPSIAPSNLIVYRSDVYGSLKNRVLVGALKLRHINIISLNKNLQADKETRLFEDLDERIRCISQNPKGKLYFSTDRGNIYTIVKTNGF